MGTIIHNEISKLDAIIRNYKSLIKCKYNESRRIKINSDTIFPSKQNFIFQIIALKCLQSKS